MIDVAIFRFSSCLVGETADPLQVCRAGCVSRRPALGPGSARVEELTVEDERHQAPYCTGSSRPLTHSSMELTRGTPGVLRKSAYHTGRNHA